MVERASVSWLAAEPVVERLQLDATSWVDIVRGFVPDADAVHDDLASTVHTALEPAHVSIWLADR